MGDIGQAVADEVRNLLQPGSDLPDLTSREPRDWLWFALYDLEAVSVALDGAADEQRLAGCAARCLVAATACAAPPGHVASDVQELALASIPERIEKSLDIPGGSVTSKVAGALSQIQGAARAAAPVAGSASKSEDFADYLLKAAGKIATIAVLS